MGFLKEKSSYRPTRAETAAGWIVTCASGLAVGWFLLGALVGR